MISWDGNEMKSNQEAETWNIFWQTSTRRWNLLITFTTKSDILLTFRGRNYSSLRRSGLAERGCLGLTTAKFQFSSAGELIEKQMTNDS